MSMLLAAQAHVHIATRSAQLSLLPILLEMDAVRPVESPQIEAHEERLWGITEVSVSIPVLNECRPQDDHGYNFHNCRGYFRGACLLTQDYPTMPCNHLVVRELELVLFQIQGYVHFF